MSFCYDMLQDIKRNIGENFSVEYRNYILLQSKIKEDIEHDRFHFIERSQGAEMSIFIENVMTVASSSIISKHDDSNLDDLVSHILDRKKFVEALDQENEKESKNFMNTFMAMITEPNHSSIHQNIRQSSNGQPGISKISIGQQNILQPNASHHSIVPSNLNPQTSTNGSNKFRSSVEVHDHESLQSVFRKAQKGINCRDNLRKKAMVSESIELPSNNEDPNYLRSITSKFKSSKYKKNISLQRFITSRTRIINSEDESVESSDNEFSKKSRHYNNPMRMISISSSIKNSLANDKYIQIKPAPMTIDFQNGIKSENPIQWSEFDTNKVSLSELRRNLVNQNHFVSQPLKNVSQKSKPKKFKLKSMVNQMNGSERKNYLSASTKNSGNKHSLSVRPIFNFSESKLQ